MNKIIQTSCSELLVDTLIEDPEVAYEQITGLMKLCEWESSPPLTLKILRDMKIRDEGNRSKQVPEVVVFDKDGNRAFIEYGDNGYDHTGYRFDSHCNHCDSQCFPIFKKAIEKLGGELEAYDGGSTESYEEWEANPEDYNNQS